MAESIKQSFEELARKRASGVYKTTCQKHTTLYHYTDAAGLLGMLESGRVWATDYRYLNDRSEIEHTRSLVQRFISDRLKTSNDDLEKGLFNAVVEYQAMEPMWDPYVFSLSEEDDDLSQWRGYARDGQGFTIGLDAWAISDLVAASEQNSETDYGFVCVEYQEKKQKQAINSLFSEFKTLLRDAAQQGASDIAHLIDDAALWLEWAIGSYAVVNKHRSFHLEKEWRIIEAIPRDRQSRVSVRASGTRLVRYVPLRLNMDGPDKLPITRIGIGPGFSGNEPEFAIRAKCAQKGYDPEIYFADTPFRTL